MRRTAIAIAIEKVVPGDVYGQWLHLLRQRYWPGPLYRLRDYPIVAARNGLTKLALSHDDWDDFLSVDSDIVPDVRLPERIQELVELPEYQAKDGGVICGTYYGRAYPYEVNLFNPHPEAEGMQFIHPARWLAALEHAKRCYVEGKPAPLYPVGGGGTGLMLIRRDVLERLQAEKGVNQVWETAPIEPELLKRIREVGEDRANGMWTEDVFFCMEVKKRLGITVLGDTDLRFSGGHVNMDTKGVRDYVAAHTLPAGLEGVKPELPFGYEVVQPNRAARRRAEHSLP